MRVILPTNQLSGLTGAVQYEISAANHLRPYLGDLEIRHVTVRHIEHVLRHHRGEGRSTATLERHLHAVLEVAFKLGAITENPMKRVEREERDDDPQVQVVAPSGFQEMRRLAHRWETSARRGGPLPTTPLLLFLLLLAATGLRPGEVLALRWTDLTLDGDSPTLYVTGTLKKLKGLPVYRQPVPKSKKSVRAIALAPDLVAALESHRAFQKSQGISHPENAVFATSTGTWMAYRNILRAWHDAFEGTAVAAYSPKALRSTVLTNLLNLGLHREAQAQAGHSSLRITERYYDGGMPEAPPTAHVMQAFLTGRVSE